MYDFFAVLIDELLEANFNLMYDKLQNRPIINRQIARILNLSFRRRHQNKSFVLINIIPNNPEEHPDFIDWIEKIKNLMYESNILVKMTPKFYKDQFDAYLRKLNAYAIIHNN